MAKKDTAKFFQLMNEANNKIAAREADEKKAKQEEQAKIDPTRVQRDAERRDRLGTLRAREHPRSRPKGAHPVFGHVDLSRE